MGIHLVMLTEYVSWYYVNLSKGVSMQNFLKFILHDTQLPSLFMLPGTYIIDLRLTR